MDQAITEILPQASSTTNLLAHLGAFSLVFHLLATRLVVIVIITLEVLVLNTLWPKTETTMSSPNQRPTSLGAEKGI